jgi:hypothetical protein
MIKAISQIAVGSKIFKKGETVTGLSGLDKKWMKEEGLIEVLEDRKPQKKHAAKKKEED